MYMAVKKAVKKVAANIIDTLEPNPTHNEYGVCIDCQNGNPDCLHNNLVETNGGTFCNLCGYKV